MVITNENRQKTEIYESKMNSANLYAVRQGVELYQEKCKTLFQERGHYISLNEMQTKHNTFKKEAENKVYFKLQKSCSRLLFFFSSSIRWHPKMVLTMNPARTLLTKKLTALINCMVKFEEIMFQSKNQVDVLFCRQNILLPFVLFIKNILFKCNIWWLRGYYTFFM